MTPAEAASASPGRDTTIDVEAIRREFPILGRTLENGQPLVYLDNGASAQKPRCVVDKMTECAETYYANAYRGVYEFGARVDEEMEAARAKVADFVGAREPEEIVFTSGTTMSINLVARAWGGKFLKPGDEIVLNVMEHHANIVPWQIAAKERQARLKYIPLTADGHLDLNRLDEALSDRTRVVAVTGMSNVLGTINPVRELAAAAHRRGAVILVDAAQTAPHAGMNVVADDIDFLAFSGHKLYGPTGIGALYGRRTLLEEMDPFLGGGHMIDEVELDHSTWAEIPAKFEAGTLPIVEAIGLGRAIDFVKSIGWERIIAHERRLVAHAFRRLGEIEGLTILGPGPEHRGGIVSFVMERFHHHEPNKSYLHPHDIAETCNLARGVAVRGGHHCTKLLHRWLNIDASTRASFGVYNTEAEIDVLADALRIVKDRLDRSRPDTPRRPR